MKNKVFVIVVTYNASKWLKWCLESVKEFPTIVVDNNSTDDSIDLIQNFFPEVHLFKQNQNLGFGRANNIGIKFAIEKGADYVFLLNQDARLEEDCITKLLESHRKNSEFGIISPIHLNGIGQKLDYNFATYIDSIAAPDLLTDFILHKRIKDIYSVSFVNAAGWLISRDCLEKVGGFDPIFFHYGEDSNYCQRVKFAGLSIGVVPDCFLFHDRENRVSTESTEAREERLLKIIYGDVNKNNIEPLLQKVKDLKQKKRKAIIRMKFKKARNYQTEAEELTTLIIEIQKSLSENRTLAMNHL